MILLYSIGTVTLTRAGIHYGKNFDLIMGGLHHGRISLSTKGSGELQVYSAAWNVSTGNSTFAIARGNVTVIVHRIGV